MQNQVYAIEVRNVQRVYGNGDRAVTALSNVQLRIPHGRFIALKGKSGSGKTTLINCIGGLDEPTGGEILIENRPIQALNDDERTAWRQKEVGFIFQSFGLLPTLSAYENVEYMLRIAGFPRKDRHARTLECLELVGLMPWKDHRPYEMSGGQNQRVAIARALANRPKIILADEATGELDSETARDILNLLQTIAREENVTILLATHDGLVDEYVDEVIQLVDGRIVGQRDVVEEDGSSAEMPPDPTHLPSSQPPTASPLSTWNTLDTLAVCLTFAVALLIYGRTLAPDLLYSDSGEFQMMAHTPGIAHPTGYPIYVSISWLFKYLIPIGTIAWRINFLSALAAAGTVAGVFTLARLLTRRRDAAVYAALALAISYAFWSQAVMAEVYTLGMLWWVLMFLCLMRWHHAPDERLHWLFAAALLSGLGMGVHLYTTLIAPAALVLFWQTVRTRPNWRTPFMAAVAGLGVGLAIYLVAFFVIDAQQSLTDFNRMMFAPSMDAWELQPSDFDSAWERFYHVVGSTQWQAAMFPDGFSLVFMGERLLWYMGGLLWREFGLVTFIAAIVGIVAIWRENRPIANLLLVSFFTVIAIILNYEPGDKHLFYLPSYVALVVAASVGFAVWLRWVEMRFRPNVAIIFPLLLIILIGQHLWPNRLQALVDGKASFVTDTYPYPVDDLDEPRRVATKYANQLPDGALALINWQPLYATLYVAHVEQDKTNVGIIEPTPYGTNGRVMPTLIALIEEALATGRPVYADAPYTLSRHFRLERTDSGLYQLSLRE